MFRLFVFAVVIWLLFTFTEPIITRLAQVASWIGTFVDITFTL